MRRIAISIIAAVAWAATTNLPARAETGQDRTLAIFSARLEVAEGANSLSPTEFKRSPSAIDELIACCGAAVV